MKGIIESSVYLVIMTLICVISIQFIIMNRQISKVGEVSGYIRDYIEIHATGTKDLKIDKKTEEYLQKYANENHMLFSYKYEDATSQYQYYDIQIEYSLRFPLFHLNKQHKYKRLAKVPLTS